MRTFYEPVALTPYEVKDIAQALLAVVRPLTADKTLDWCRAPTGMQPDVYLSHLRNVDLAEEMEESEGYRFGQSSNRHLQRMVLDEQGRYAGKPVALLGEDESTHHAWRFENDEQKAQLLQILDDAAGDNMAQLSAQFTLASRIVALRKYWSTHHLLFLQGSGGTAVLAAVTVRNRKVWWQRHLQTRALEKAKIRMVHYDRNQDFNPEGYAPLPFWPLFWDYVQRCALTDVHTMLPMPDWSMMVRLHRTSHLPQQGVGDIAHAILRELEKEPASINDLMRQQAGQDPEEWFRAMVGLLFIRAITFDITQSTF